MNDPGLALQSKPVAIDHANDKRKSLLFIDWSLNNHCNYRCSYCPPHLHNGGYKGPSYDQVVRLIEQMSSGSNSSWRHFQFTGGEPTAYKHLARVLDYTKSHGNTTGLISNGSRPLNWWRDHQHLVDEITLTFHVEMADRDHFLALVELIHETVNVHVNVTMLPERFEECSAFADLLADRFSDISISLKPLLIGFRTELYPYSDDQRRHLVTYSWPGRHPRTNERAKGHMLVSFEDGHQEKLGASRLVALGLNRFLGWRCNVGIEMICVFASGEIVRGICREGGILGTVADGLIHLPKTPVVCSRPVCKCLADVSVTKRMVVDGDRGLLS